MAVVCPTVLASDAHDFQTQINRVTLFAKRVQIDLTDGVFAPTPTVTFEQVWSPEGMKIDLHLMFKNPLEYLGDALKLNPHMIIVHAEAEGNFLRLANVVHKHGVKVGVALLANTSTHIIKPSLQEIDHVLIFSGDLGKFGGVADLSLLSKVSQLKEWKKGLEFGWDGGINDTNAKQLVDGGIDILNVGGYIQNAAEPKLNFEKLKSLIA